MLTLRVVGWGFLTGLLAAGGLAVADGTLNNGYMFGLQTAVIGVPLGGAMLVMAFLMSLLSYWLAQKGMLAGLRRYLLASAVFTGPAGMACGLASVAIWAAAGRPWFP